MTFTLSTIRARGSLEPPGSMTAFAEQVQVMWRGSTVTAAPKARVTDGLTERTRGVFYRKSSAFLHFHEDPAGFFADVKTGPAWQRVPATTPADRRALLRLVRNHA